MDKVRFLIGEASGENHVLETDIMRFVAIIGMVLWIIFAIAKSIPFQVPKTDSPLPGPPKKEYLTTQPPLPVVKKTPVKEKKQGPAPEDKKKKHKQTKTPGIEQRPPKGIHIQFGALEDLLELMAGRKVRIFCRARATGFDLLFEGLALGGSVTFHSTKDLPSKLWEIKSGKDHAYFLGLVTNAYPVIRTFPLKQVLLAFTDKALEESVEKTLASLRKDGKEGIISIGRRGRISYQSQGGKTEKFE